MNVQPPDPLDLIPDPSEIQNRIVVNARKQRILRRLLRLSLTAKRELQADTTKRRSQATPAQNGEVACLTT